MSLSNSVDSRLMAKKQLTPEEQSRAAVDLKTSKQPNTDYSEQGATVGQEQGIARKAKENNKSKSLKKALPSKANIASATALKSAWLNIIDSFGLTLIYINLHFFGRSILGEKAFCELGEEWVPRNLQSSLESSAVKSAIKKIALLEKMLLIFLDSLLIICLTIICILLAVVVSVVSGTVWERFTNAWAIFFGN